MGNGSWVGKESREGGVRWFSFVVVPEWRSLVARGVFFFTIDSARFLTVRVGSGIGEWS